MIDTRLTWFLDIIRAHAPPPHPSPPPSIHAGGRRGRSSEGRAVMCRRCGNLAIVPVMGRSIVFCSCGAPIINDLLMSLLAEGGGAGGGECFTMEDAG